MSQPTVTEEERRNTSRLKSLLIRSIVFAALGVAFIWLPTVDMLARQVAITGAESAAPATTAPAQVQSSSGNRVTGSLPAGSAVAGPIAASPASSPTTPGAGGIGKAQIGSSILASCGIVALVALNYFLRRRRVRQ